jgi:hypothetical protein
MCKYSFYKEKEGNKSQLYCKLNDSTCVYSKFCNKQNKYIHREGADDCYMALEENKKQIPNGSHYVRFIRKGYAYVEIDNKVVKIKDTLGNINNYVYIAVQNGQYIISLSPIDDKPKRQYNRKKKD